MYKSLGIQSRGINQMTIDLLRAFIKLYSAPIHISWSPLPGNSIIFRSREFFAFVTYHSHRQRIDKLLCRLSSKLGIVDNRWPMQSTLSAASRQSEKLREIWYFTCDKKSNSNNKFVYNKARENYTFQNSRYKYRNAYPRHN